MNSLAIQRNLRKSSIRMRQYALLLCAVILPLFCMAQTAPTDPIEGPVLPTTSTDSIPTPTDSIPTPTDSISAPVDTTGSSDIVEICELQTTTLVEGFEKAAFQSAYQGTRILSADESDCGIEWEIFYGNVSTTINYRIEGNNVAVIQRTESKKAGYIRNVQPIEGLRRIEFLAKAPKLTSMQTLPFYVSTSKNGTKWTKQALFSLPYKFATTYQVDIPNTEKYIRIEFATQNGFISIDNLTLTIDNLTGISVEDTLPEPRIMQIGDSATADGLLAKMLLSTCSEGVAIDGSEVEWDFEPRFIDENTQQITAKASFRGYTASCTLPIEPVFFHESFNKNTGIGGNDGQWSGIGEQSDIEPDREEWIFINGYGTDHCALLGTADSPGEATTPSISFEGDATLTFRAGAWNDDADSTILHISPSSGIPSPATITLRKGEWTDYTIHLWQMYDNSTITFSSPFSPSRFFLDDITLSHLTFDDLEFSEVHTSILDEQTSTSLCKFEGYVRAIKQQSDSIIYSIQETRPASGALDDSTFIEESGISVLNPLTLNRKGLEPEPGTKVIVSGYITPSGITNSTILGVDEYGWPTGINDSTISSPSNDCTPAEPHSGDASPATKLLINGQLLILHGSRLYTPLGFEVHPED